MEKSKAYLCGDHWDRCLHNDPCETCPSKAENRESVEQLAKMTDIETAKLNASLIAKVSVLSRTLHGNGDALNGFKGILVRLELLEAREKWLARSTEKWTSRIMVIISILIAAGALIVSIQ